MDLTVKQAAEKLQVSTKTIFRRIADGSLPAYKLGVKLVRIRQSDLDEYVNRNKTT